jgi:hypothetical protein
MQGRMRGLRAAPPAREEVAVKRERLMEVVSYDPETGVFRWRERPNRRIRAGDVAGSMQNTYWRVAIDGTEYLAHRLAWLYMNGEWPSVQIDHINGIRTDNRISNLRDVLPAVNCQNQRNAQAKNLSGYLGVSTKAGGKWLARIHKAGKPIRIGLFDSPEAAHQAYLEAKRRLHEGCTI